ncbi:MAG: DUF3090 family protein [Dehalococcoidia bacterium]|nr:DUF3090 family protein [Dehalococcoidia bacterium]
MWDFGRAELLEPEAIGQPGERLFRLRVMSGSDAASLWLEKEQLAALTLAIRQLLEQTSESAPPTEPDLPPAGGPFPNEAEVDFKIGRLGIGYDESQRMVVIFAYTMAEDDEDAPPTFACQVSRDQSRLFAERAEDTINAGRPVCVLCGGPLDKDGHACLRRNGHSDHPISLE